MARGQAIPPRPPKSFALTTRARESGKSRTGKNHYNEMQAVRAMKDKMMDDDDDEDEDEEM